MFSRSQLGMSLIELLIGIVIMSILLAIAMPSFTDWMGNVRIRTTAEALQNGLQVARAEAIRRNTLVRFQLTSTLDNGCTLSTSAGNWVVSLDDATSLCASNAINEAFAANDAVNNPSPRLIQKRSAAEGSSGITIAADQSTVTFSGLGRVTPTPGATGISINVSNTLGGATCMASGGTMRCLRVQIAAGGQIRLCDPTRASTDPEGC